MLDSIRQKLMNYQLFDRKSILEKPQKEVVFENYDVAFQDVSFSYDSTPILQNITFQTPQNTMTAIVGMSGSGKTIMMHLIMRYWDVEQGTIKIGGLPIQKYPIEELMKVISVVSQENYLFCDTIYNNIAMGKPDVTKEEVINAAKRACCHDFIKTFPQGYDTMVEEKANLLSGGERQRIALARAILKDAPILILDEATSNIDSVHEAEIQREIKNLAKEKTVFVVTHEFSSITKVDQILVLKKGKLIEKGTHRELLQVNGQYADLWNRQQGVNDWTIR